jgi:tetratricopeptide (TPR) repeat protein
MNHRQNHQRTTAMPLLRFALMLLAACALAAPVRASPPPPTLVEKIPVERLIKNLGAAVERNPKDVQAMLNLARAHAWAYSLGDDEGIVPKNRLWFSDMPPFSPEIWGPVIDETPRPGIVRGFVDRFNQDAIAREKQNRLKAAQAAAPAHLEQAIKLYAQARQLAPDEQVVQLGYGWLLSLTERKDEAIGQLRETIAKGSDANGYKPDKSGTIALEAVKYLIPLLDKNDAIQMMRDAAAREWKRKSPLASGVVERLIALLDADKDKEEIARWQKPLADWKAEALRMEGMRPSPPSPSP